ncbi:hypothetical protein D3C85_1415970 [compost metagenome]
MGCRWRIVNPYDTCIICDYDCVLSIDSSTGANHYPYYHLSTRICRIPTTEYRIVVQKMADIFCNTTISISVNVHFVRRFTVSRLLYHGIREAGYHDWPVDVYGRTCRTSNSTIYYTAPY